MTEPSRKAGFSTTASAPRRSPACSAAATRRSFTPAPFSGISAPHATESSSFFEKKSIFPLAVFTFCFIFSKQASKQTEQRGFRRCGICATYVTSFLTWMGRSIMEGGSIRPPCPFCVFWRSGRSGTPFSRTTPPAVQNSMGRNFTRWGSTPVRRSSIFQPTTRSIS